MTHQTTPHTQSQQNMNPAQSDLEPGEPQQDTVGDGLHAEGAQTGSNRASENHTGTTGKHNIEPATAAHEGTLSSRTPAGQSQGITSHSSDEESSRQEKVVKDRPDAQAGVNHSR
jgi:hypothetical protein